MASDAAFFKNLLTGKKTIMEYLDLSSDLYDKFRIDGVPINGKKVKMPILVIDRRHYATKYRLDEFWNMVTLADSSKIVDDGDED